MWSWYLIHGIIYGYKSVLSCIVLFFFFFKQKTAYEMRISDWSSDVCSSDLQVGTQGLPGRRQAALAQGGADAGGQVRAVAQQEIGRASCRERVCQYV